MFGVGAFHGFRLLIIGASMSFASVAGGSENGLGGDHSRRDFLSGSPPRSVVSRATWQDTLLDQPREPVRIPGCARCRRASSTCGVSQRQRWWTGSICGGGELVTTARAAWAPPASACSSIMSPIRSLGAGGGEINKHDAFV